MSKPIVTSGPGPVVATAIHAGHELAPSVASRLALSEADRLREEDPATERIAAIEGTRIIVTTSRFQVDLNRPRDRAVYRLPEDAWGLVLWRTPPSERLVSEALAFHDEFYRIAARTIERVIEREGWALVIDVHSYNHRREGASADPDDPAHNPEVNVGTGSLDRSRWGSEVDAFESAVAGAGYDVRENVKFLGGQFSRWVNETYPDSACALAVEFKKTFMDEWSGSVDDALVERARRALDVAARAAAGAHEKGRA